ncbi:uncharacterized protein LOC103721617 isoform X1 [Phoenix dactylifera]|uniref:Uncharacterized protein LOC103721617 isoform X1 n=1 Tax=Phoenix dactylifera TaxID=42345 RepID=A0A8B9AA60_PHODC|nr:uncharacterized protein LOC103721617 isoform X1 [Phoenix dactylifera]
MAAGSSSPQPVIARPPALGPVYFVLSLLFLSLYGVSVYLSPVWARGKEENEGEGEGEHLVSLLIAIHIYKYPTSLGSSERSERVRPEKPVNGVFARGLALLRSSQLQPTPTRRSFRPAFLISTEARNILLRQLYQKSEEKLRPKRAASDLLTPDHGYKQPRGAFADCSY